MKLKDILNMEEYLQNDCYCPNEIYDGGGFFYQLFYADDECKLLGKTKHDSQYYKDCYIVLCKDQIIAFGFDENEKINFAERYDATENNIKLFKSVIEDNYNGMKLDVFDKEKTKKSYQELFSLADMIMYD